MTDKMKVREAFEAYVTREHECSPDDLKWDESRNCYAMWAMHFAYQAWEERDALAHVSSARGEECSVVGDAARYRYVRSSCGEFVQYAGGGTHHLLEDEELDRAIDQAIAGRRGDGNG